MPLTPLDKTFLQESLRIKPQSKTHAAWPEIKVMSDYRPIPINLARTSKSPNKSLLNILSTRQSHRLLGPITSGELCELLFHSCRVRYAWIADDGLRVSSRPTPSAGARHPIECVCILNKVKGIKKGCWHMDPFSLTLQHARVPESFINYYNKISRKIFDTPTPPPAIILFTAILERTLRRYPAGLSLIWRDAGAIGTTISMTAEGLGIASCLMGFSCPLRSAHSFSLKNTQSWVMGGIAIGSIRL